MRLWHVQYMFLGRQHALLVFAETADEALNQLAHASLFGQVLGEVEQEHERRVSPWLVLLCLLLVGGFVYNWGLPLVSAFRMRQ